MDTFLHSDFKPMRQEAEPLADALFELLDARAAMHQAKNKTPSYTGDRSHEDYVAEEQERYNRAADEFLRQIQKAGGSWTNETGTSIG